VRARLRVPSPHYPRDSGHKCTQRKRAPPKPQYNKPRSLAPTPQKALLQRLGEVEANWAPEKPHAGDKTTRKKTPPEKPKSPISSSPSPPRPRVPAA